MLANDVLSVNESGSVIANYYKNRDKVMQIVNDNAKYDPKTFLVSKPD